MTYAQIYLYVPPLIFVAIGAVGWFVTRNWGRD